MTEAQQHILSSQLLIVDDEPANIALLEQTLEMEGYQNIHSTNDPTQVLPLCLKNSFDLILLDIRMPGMDGFGVLEALKDIMRDNYLPVIVLTAQTDDETRARALQAGVNDFITKPFRRWEVLLRIHNMLISRCYYKQQVNRADELEQRVQDRTKEIRETQLQIIQRLGRAGEYRDNETGTHVIRMSKSSQLLALAAGLDEQHAEKILYATPMHDIGKIGIPDEILLKPGKLSNEERQIMNTHAQIGADIIGRHESEILKLAHSIALCHHEKWDGNGYPNGLKGEEIPIESRIAAICDVFDALTSSRPYKDAWPVDKALAFMNEQSGLHFDPRLISLFNQILPQVKQLREEFPDTEE